MKKLFKEPLLHFLIIGLAMFIIFDLLNDDITNNDKEILVTQSQADLLFFQWATQNGRPPSQQERDGLINHFVHQEILYREAIALGLEQNDAIIRRRLAQKMKYLFDDLIPVPEPTDDELRAYIKENPDQFMQARTLSFTHVYINTDDGLDAATIRANELLGRLRAGEAIPEGSGDRLLLPTRYTQVNEREIKSALGEIFARDIFTLPQHQWVGPIPSGYGIHLVKLMDATPDTIAPFDAIREDALKEWRYEEEKLLQDSFMKGLQEKYLVTIESGT